MAEKRTVDAEVMDVEEAIAVPDNKTIVALQRAEIDTAISTAKAYPRSIEEFKTTMLSMATLDVETAESMYYQLPRDGKLIEGPSVRLAEIAGSAWGNCRYGARVIEIGETVLTARGSCYDLQRNVATEIDVQRRITNRQGRRYNADMIQTTGLAACAIALRNAIFKVVPMAYIKPALAQAKRVAAGDEKTLGARRDAALLYFKERGVKPEQLYRLLGVKGKEDIGLDGIASLLGVRNALKDGEAKIEDFFPAEQPAGTVTVDSLAGKVTATNDSKTPEPIKPVEPPKQPPAVEPPAPPKSPAEKAPDAPSLVPPAATEPPPAKGSLAAQADDLFGK